MTPTPNDPANPGLPQPGRYRHFKGGEYEVFAVARHSETDEWLVVYRPLTGDGTWWVRPAGMFTESVAYDGQLQSRFRRVADTASHDFGSSTGDSA